LAATFSRTSCTGGPPQTSSAFVDYVRGSDGKPFIVERSRSGSWLLITNGRKLGDAVVFQAVRGGEDPEFREYRFPQGGKQPGQYFWASRYAEPSGIRHRFETKPRGPTMSCQLVPVDPLTGAPLATYGSPPDASSEATAPGWGFDGSSFDVGDRVLVDVGGRSVPAVVLQAPGDAYFVRFDENGEQGGNWIEPSRITGRLD